MAASTNHLTKIATAALSLSDRERINSIYRDRWIKYTRAEEILNHMSELFERPRTQRMRNLMIVSETNNGKTTVISQFERLHPREDNPDGDAIKLPVLLVASPPFPDEGRLYDNILKKLGAPFREGDSPSKKLNQILTLAEQVELRMLIIDEIHNVLAGSPSQQRRFCNVLKTLGNELQITIIVAGIDEAFHVVQSDSQMANRFESMHLPLWEMSEEYLRFLLSFEKTLPLHEKSNLITKELAIKLCSMSEGLIGELTTIIRDAAALAIKTKKEKIDLELLKKLKWQQPSQRKYKVPPQWILEGNGNA